MSDFDNWFKKKFRDLHDAILCGDLIAGNYKKVSKKSYQAGQQSKQKAIDELQSKYNKLHDAFVVTDEARKEWSRCYNGVRQNEDVLQERITKALDMLEGREGKVLFDDILDTLKGIQE